MKKRRDVSHISQSHRTRNGQSGKKCNFHVKRQLTRLRAEEQKSTKENGTCVYDAIKQFDCET